MSPTRRRAFDELVPRYAFEHAEAADARANGRPIIVEIGCGKGDATVAMANGDGDALVIACEPNGAMIANLAALVDSAGITNVRIWLGDAFDLLGALGPASVTELRVWFPDPWPKPRHAQKRLVTPQRLALLIDALAIGGLLRLATDDPAYATETLGAIDAEPRLDGRIVARPAERPVTRFEARGLQEGRAATDIEARRGS